MRTAGGITTKALTTSACAHCHCPIGLSHWSGWLDLTRDGTHDMCPATISAVHDPSRDAA